MRDEAVRPDVTMPAAAVAMATCDHLEQLFRAPAVADIWALHTAYMARFGFDRMIYGVTRFLFSHDFGGPNDHLMLTNHDPEYIRALQEGALFGSAPMVRWTLTNTGVRSWGEVAAEEAAGQLDAAALRVLALNRAYGVTAGVSISFRNLHARARAGIGLCAARGITQAEVDAIWARNGREILLANQCMHLRIASQPFSGEAAPLTARQRQALEAVGEGKSTSDIAAHLGLTQTTVEKHLRLARAALGVETTAQAVLKASLNNQIFTSPPPAKNPR